MSCILEARVRNSVAAGHLGTGIPFVPFLPRQSRFGEFSKSSAAQNSIRDAKLPGFFRVIKIRHFWYFDFSKARWNIVRVGQIVGVGQVVGVGQIVGVGKIVGVEKIWACREQEKKSVCEMSLRVWMYYYYFILYLCIIIFKSHIILEILISHYASFISCRIIRTPSNRTCPHTFK
jgi:hypothetical protein